MRFKTETVKASYGNGDLWLELINEYEEAGWEVKDIFQLQNGTCYVVFEMEIEEELKGAVAKEVLEDDFRVAVIKRYLKTRNDVKKKLEESAEKKSENPTEDFLTNANLYSQGKLSRPPEEFLSNAKLPLSPESAQPIQDMVEELRKELHNKLHETE